MATHSSILAWRIPWTEEPGYSSWVAKSDTTEGTWHTHHAHTSMKHYFPKQHLEEGLPGSPVVKNLPSSAGDEGSIPDLGTKNPICRGATTEPKNHG